MALVLPIGTGAFRPDGTYVPRLRTFARCGPWIPRTVVDGDRSREHRRPPGRGPVLDPLGAGARFPLVRWNGRAFEAVAARRGHRAALDLYHAALEVRLDGQLFSIEMAPAWGAGSGSGDVVARGPVGTRLLGRSRYFRYEIRRSRGGVIPDIDEAVGGPRRVADGTAGARRVLDLVPGFPTMTWGRDELHAGDMWNSNSLVAWLLVRAGVDAAVIAPPPHGRAPGWTAGLVVAARPVF